MGRRQRDLETWGNRELVKAAEDALRELYNRCTDHDDEEAVEGAIDAVTLIDWKNIPNKEI